jgi:hypothetical protein
MEINECIICYVDCSTRRSDLDNYKCTCVYFIHNDCYVKWKQTGTARLCVICHINEVLPQIAQDREIVVLDPHVYAQVQLQREYEQRMRMNRCHRQCRDTCMFMLFFVFLLIHIYKMYK